MAKQDQRCIGKRLPYSTDRVPDIGNHVFPAIVIGKVRRRAGGFGRSMPTVVVGDDRDVARRGGLCEPLVTCRVFGQSVQNQNDCSRMLVRQPLPKLNRTASVCRKR